MASMRYQRPLKSNQIQLNKESLIKDKQKKKKAMNNRKKFLIKIQLKKLANHLFWLSDFVSK